MTRRRYFPAVAGVLLCGPVLAYAAVEPAVALSGWLTAFAFWSGLPIGALVLLAMTRLVPGVWRQGLGPGAEATVPLLGLAALALLPLLACPPTLYPWAGEVGQGFRGWYLSPWPFRLRGLVFFALAGLFACRLVRQPPAVPLAITTLIVLVPFQDLIASDWLMSLQPEFHSSGFGLYVLAIQVVTALAVLIPLRLVADREAPAGVLAGVWLTALLLWAYLAFMQYFISWSGDLTPGVRWYQRRGDGAWGVVEYAVAVLGLLPLFLLFFPPIRRSRAALVCLAPPVLLGKMLEMAWLVLPALPQGQGMAAIAAALALMGLGLLSWFGLRWRRP
ncbi:hypothetical protein FBZ89_12446 [Nitrospirillum amazonense]|uniref:Uncharacterized protein n=1 Tax=Nitrospirillum amazonense TaxID=28077 RepID=A0A560ESS7_9PROT|nr:hypothetical protein [Nitrospirillum amazonense]TWB12433.1 hypothetical protein FBZ89_12446 [Nitrospirillum amazonense]